MGRLMRVARAVREVRKGGTVVVHDDDDGNFVCHASHFTEAVARHWQMSSSGLTCVAMPRSTARRLILNRLPRRGDVSAAYLDSVDHVGCSTGVSAGDRSLTVRALASWVTEPCEMQSPGHILPVESAAGLLFERGGHAEASVMLMRFAGLSPVAATTHIMSECARGELAKVDELCALGAPVVGHGDLMEYIPLWARRHVHVTVKLALTLDGKLGHVGHATDVIRSNIKCLEDIVRLRQKYDAVLVGGNTARTGETRLVGAKKRMTLSSRTRPAMFDRRLGQPTLTLSLAEALVAENVRSVLVEAGPRLTRAMLKERLVSELVVYVAPRTLGVVNTLALDLPADVHLKLRSTENVGGAVKCVYDVS